jgi:hypothetical protein
MADWGLYGALRGTDNWAQRRADAQMNMQIREKMAADSEKKVQMSNQAEEGINAYLEMINSMDVLPEDQERIKEIERSARTNIIKGIAGANGDLTRYISSGGITDLHDYKNSILQSKEVKTALSNKQNMGLIVADKQKGRWMNKVPQKLPVINKETGEQELDEKGNPLFEEQMMSVDDQLKLFKRGVIQNINYNGSENKVRLNPMAFKSHYKDAANPTGPNSVTASDIMFQAMESGAGEEQARALADSYVKRWKAGKERGQDLSWKWKSMSPQEEALYRAKTLKTLGATGGGEEQQIANYYNNALKGKGREKQAKEGTYAEWGGEGSKYKRHNVTLEETDVLLRAIGLNRKHITKEAMFDADNDYIDVAQIKNQNHVPDGNIYSPRTGEPVNLTGTNYSIVGVEPSVINVKGKPYMQAQVYMDEDAADKSGIRSESGIDHITDGWKSLTEDVGGGGMTGDNYIVTALIPLNDSPSASAYYSKEQAGAKWQEDVGVESTGYGGRGELDLSSIGF